MLAVIGINVTGYIEFETRVSVNKRQCDKGLLEV
jgi:hypothetical protein